MLKPEETNALEKIDTFARDDVAQAANGWSLGEMPHQSIYKKAADLGLLRLEVPQQFGGQGFSFAMKAKVSEILAGADFGFAMSLINTHNAGARIVESAPSSLREQYLPDILSGKINACTALTEPNAGSDFAAIKSTAKKTTHGWVLNGEKTWIVNARHADLSVVFAHCDKGDDNAANGANIGAFLVDLNASGVTRYKIDSPFSQTSMGTGGFTFENVELSDDHLLLPAGTAFKAILNEINGARIYVAAMCCGMLSAALNDTIEYGETRHAFGKALSQHQGWRLPVAEATTAHSAASALVEKAVAALSNGEPAQQLAAEAKVFAARTCQAQIPVLLQAMGAEGLKADHCHARHLAAAHIAAFTDGSQSMLLERIAKLSKPKTKSN